MQLYVLKFKKYEYVYVLEIITDKIKTNFKLTKNILLCILFKSYIVVVKSLF